MEEIKGIIKAMPKIKPDYDKLKIVERVTPEYCVNKSKLDNSAIDTVVLQNI